MPRTATATSVFDRFYSPSTQPLFLDLVRNGYVSVISRFVKTGLLHSPPDPTILEWKDARSLFVHAELTVCERAVWRGEPTLRFYDLERLSQPNWSVLGVSGDDARLLLRRCRELPLCTDLAWRYRNLHAHPKQLAPLGGLHASMLASTALLLVDLDAGMSLDPDDRATMTRFLTHYLHAGLDRVGAASDLPESPPRPEPPDGSSAADVLAAVKVVGDRITALEATVDDRADGLLTRIDAVPAAFTALLPDRPPAAPRGSRPAGPPPIPATGPLTRVQAARLLFQRRDEITKEHDLKPWQNILQGPIVHALLNCSAADLPTDSVGLRHLEAFESKYRQYQSLMDQQLDSHLLWILDTCRRYHAGRSRST